MKESVRVKTFVVVVVAVVVVVVVVVVVAVVVVVVVVVAVCSINLKSFFHLRSFHLQSLLSIQFKRDNLDSYTTCLRLTAQR